MVISKNFTPPPDIVDRASEQLRQLILDGSSRGCETVLESFPELQAERDHVLELIYLEYVLRRDRQVELETEDLVDEYIQRFPEHAEEIVKLLQVDLAFNSLNPDSKHRQSEDLDDNADETDETAGAWGPSLGTIGDYRLVDVLGQGGMGIVYRAVQKRLGRAVAIKTIQVTKELDSATILRFQKEAELASSLQHPNIAQIYEVGTHNEIPFYSMEYVPAGSLAQFLRDRPLKPELAANLVAVLARAVDYAHQQDVLHRDLKPANILLSPSTRPEAIEIPDSRKANDSKANKHSFESNERYEPKIVDFGLAIQLSSIAKNQLDPAKLKGRAVGTPSYMAPEQVDPSLGLAGPSTDVYALGSILYHALVGRPPFYAASTQETLRQVCHDDPTPPTELQPKIAGDLETICLKCLRKVPATRYHSALELADDLQRYLQGKPIQARPTSIPKRMYKWGVRNPSLVVLMAAMLVATLLTTWLWRHSAESLSAELAERSRGEQLNYDRNINLAYHEFKSNNVERALDLLSQCPISFRDWEWHFVKSICEECLWQCESQESMRLATSSLSPDGQYVATGHGHWGYDAKQSVHVWKTGSTKQLWKLAGHPPSQIACVRFHPTQPRLLSSAISWENGSKQPGLVIEWDLETGKQLRTIDKTNAHVALYSHNGQQIFVGDTSGTVKCFDATTGKLRWRNLRPVHASMVLGMCLSSDGEFLATSARDGTLAVWNTQSGAPVTKMNEMGDPRVVAWSPDMQKLTVCQYGGRLDVFRWKDKTLIHESTSSESNSQIMAYAPDGLTFASSVQGGSIDLRRAEQGESIRQFHGHRGQVRAISFDRYGRRMLTAGADGTCRLWDLTKIDGYTKKTERDYGQVESIDYHPQSQKFVVAIGPQRARPRNVGKPCLEIWDSIRHKLITKIYGHQDWLTTARFSRDGERLLSGSRDKTVRIWDANSKAELAVFRGHVDRIVLAEYWQTDRVVSVDASGLLKIWNIQTQEALESWSVAQPVMDGPPALSVCAMHDKSGLLAVAESQAIAFWDLSKKQKLASFPCADLITDLKFSWDGTRLGVASSNPEICVFNVSNLLATRELPEPQRLRGHIRQVTSLAFSPDNTRLAAAGLDEALTVFELNLGHEVLKMDDNVGINNRISFSRDGKQLTTCEAPYICTYSLDRLDHKAGQSPEQAITTWHIEKYNESLYRRNAHAAVIHARILVERQPSVPQHCLWLANSLTDLGEYDQAVKTLREMTASSDEERFKRLDQLLRTHLLAKNLDDYRDCCLEYAQLVTQTGDASHWNNFAWFATLGKASGIDLASHRTKLEEVLENRRAELDALNALETQLKGLASPQELADDALLKLEIERVDAAVAPVILASKKNQARQSLGVMYNTMALFYYRLGKYEEAYLASKESLALDRLAQPLDHLIQAMSLCQLHRQSAEAEAPAADLPTDSEVKLKLRDLKSSVQSLLHHVEQWEERARRREYSVTRNTLSDIHLRQLDLNLLLSEIQPLLVEAKINPHSKRPSPMQQKLHEVMNSFQKTLNLSLSP